jgi:dTDP-glucose pyrophosphorylase
MQAVIVAAGESSRFWPLNKKHKSLTSFFGKPLLYWTIKSLSDKGISDIIVVMSPESSLDKDISFAASELGVTLSFVVQDKPLGTGDAIYRTKDIVKGPFLVSWPYKVNIGEVLEKIREEQKGKKSRFWFVCRPKILQTTAFSDSKGTRLPK